MEKETTLKDLLKSARDGVAAKKYTDAIAYCKDILSNYDKKNYNALIFYAVSCSHTGQLEQSEKAYRKAVEFQPTNLLALQGLVELFSTTSDWQKLLDALAELFKLIKPDHAKFYEYTSKKAHALAKLAKRPEAIEVWRHLIPHCKTPEQTNAAFVAVAELQEADEKEAAEAEVQKRCLSLMKTKTQFASVEAMKQSVERDVQNERLMSSPLDETYRQLVELGQESSTYNNKLITRHLQRIELVSKEAKVKFREELQRLCTAALPRQPNFLGLETYLLLQEDVLLGQSLASYVPPPHHLVFYKRLVHAFPDRGLSAIGFAYLDLLMGKREEALSFVETGLRKCPESVFGWELQSTLLSENTAFQGVLEAVSKGLSAVASRERIFGANLSNVSLRFELLRAKALLGLNRKEEARAQFVKLLAAAPDNIDIRKGLAQLDVSAGDFASAKAHLLHVLSLQPQDDSARSQLGWIAFSTSRLPEARTHLEEATKLNPGVALHWYRLGATYWTLDGECRTDKRFALSALLRAAKLETNSASAFTLLGHFYRLVDKDNERARKCYQRAVTLDPLESEAGIALADMYLAAGQEALALVLYRDVSQRSTRALWAWIRLALWQHSHGQHKEAIESFQSIIRIDPVHCVSWRGLAEAYRLQGKFMAALKAFSRTLELEPTNEYAQYEVAAIKLQLGLREEAVKSFTTILDNNSNYLPAIKGLAEASLAVAREQLTQNYHHRARESQERALQMALQCTAAQSNLQSLWKLLGDIHVFHYHLVLAQTFDELTPESIRGVAAQQLSVLKSARTAYLKAVHLSPHSATTYFDLGLTYYFESKVAPSAQVTASAIRCCKVALSMEPGNSVFWNALGIVESRASVSQHAFLMAMQVDPKGAASWSNLGYLFVEHAQFALAQRAFSQAQLIEPNQPAGWVGQGLLSELESTVSAPSTAAARAAYANAEQIKALPEVELSLGYAAFADEQFDMAASALRRFLQWDPLHCGAHNVLGLSLELLGRYREAAKSFTNALLLCENLPTSTSTSPTSTISANSSLTVLEPNSAELDSATQLNYLRGNRARVMTLLGDYPAAIADYKAISNPGAETLKGLSIALFLSAQTAAALQTVQKAASAVKNAAEKLSLVLLQTRMLFQMKDTAKARQSALNAVKEFPASEEAWEVLFAVSVALQDLAGARAALDTLSRITHMSAETHRLAALCSQLTRDFPQAKRDLCKALHLRPDRADIAAELGALLVDASHTTAALRAVIANFLPSPEATRDLNVIASARLLVGRTAVSSAVTVRRALSAAQRSQRNALSPHATLLHALAAYSTAAQKRRVSDWSAAAELLQLAISLAPSPDMTASLQLALSDCLSAVPARGSHALQLAQEVLARVPPVSALCAAAHRQVARCHTALRQLDLAKKAYRNSLSADPTSLHTWHELANLYRHSQQLAAAELCLTQCTQSVAASARPSAHLLLAHFLLTVRKYEASIAAAQSALDVRESALAYLLQGACYAKLNRWEDAEWCLGGVIAIEAATPLASLLLSEAHIRAGDLTTAESDAFYERDTSPLCDAVPFQLSCISLLSKAHVDAAAFVQRAIHLNPTRQEYWALLTKLKSTRGK